MSRILIFTGKGGVGKTSVAAAHARLSAREGKKTLLFSSDMAHNLSDLFEQKIGRQETRLSENLYALEADPDYMMEHDYAYMVRAVVNMLSSTGTDTDILDKGLKFPGMDEMFSLLKILDLYESRKYERIVIDCAPTGETLALLKFPELLCWYMEKFFPVGKLAMRVLSPVSKKLFKVQLPDQAAMTDIEKLYVRLIALQELLKDRDTVSVRIVTMPEKMVVEETKRNYMYLNLYGYYVDGVYVNRMLPPSLHNPFFTQWMEMQKKYREELADIFQGIPQLEIPWYERDLCGTDSLDRMCDEVLSGQRVFEVREHKAGEMYEKTETGYTMRVFVPCLKKEQLDLYQSGTDIILKAGNFKRNIALPNILRDYVITGAKIKDQNVEILFALTGR
ncbi:MAG: ArsA family ATPase [Lachnospiraceae bacterium]|jgi:arsenite-transporting ATPase|nr:ArsA family ATPase [Lachnospiraceae bacterium]